MLTGIGSFFNQKILRNSQQNSAARVGLTNIFTSNLWHSLRYQLGFKLTLQWPNNTLKFPLPNRWCNTKQNQSKQQLYMVVKQLGLNFKPAGNSQLQQIRKDHDHARGAINTMGFLGTLHDGQIENIKLARQKYGLVKNGEEKYTPERELFFADSLVNGQCAYMLRKYGNEYYEIGESQWVDGDTTHKLPSSKTIDQAYREAFEQSLSKETFNDNSKHYGLTREDIKVRLRKNQGVYTMLYEHLEKVASQEALKKMGKGQTASEVIITNPIIYIQNELINEEHYLHVPYPIFLKVDQPTPGFILVAVGFRIQGKVHIFSPFFANQPERLWRLVQSHIGQVALNDFSVRVHLGIYHFTTLQYHVPIYRFMGEMKDENEKKLMECFIQHCYSMFSRGLEGVNVSATASLVHPEERYSLINKALNISQPHAIQIIAETSNNVKIAQFNPEQILRRQGITNVDQKEFPKFYFDIQLYEKLSSYVEGVYKAFKIDEMEEGLFEMINKWTPNMAVGQKGTPHRPLLQKKEDVLKTLQNICFTWVGFHSHTFSVISLGTYALMRPSMLKRQIPVKPEDWQKIIIGDQLPHPKILMETGKLNEATTQKDADNILLDQIRRQAESATYHQHHPQNNQESQEEVIKGYRQLKDVAMSTIKQLREHEDQILTVNRERRQKGSSFTLQWMLPSKMQTSLNI